MTMKTIVTKIKPNMKGKVTDIRRNGGLETHALEAQGGNSLSFVATGDPNPIAEAFRFSLVSPQNIVGVRLDLGLESHQS